MSKPFVLIATGNELVKGKKVNTNTCHIANVLNEHDLSVKAHIICCDDSDQLIELINTYIKDNHVIITGGLGPTDDDITREAVAEVSLKPLQYSSEISHVVANFLATKQLTMHERHHKQCYFPEDSLIYRNDFGTACGFVGLYENNYIYVLPGPPTENQPMFNNMMNHIREHNSVFKQHKLHWQVSAPEERIVTYINKIIKDNELELETCAHKGQACDVYLNLLSENWSIMAIKNLEQSITQCWDEAGISYKSMHKLIGDIND